MSGRLADAILVGRDLLNRYPDILSRRLQPHSKLEANCSRPEVGVPVFEELGPGALSIGEAVRRQASITNDCEFRIERVDVPAEVATIKAGEDGSAKTPDRIIRSTLLRYRSRAEILIVDNLNPCWKRFAMCKEYAHLIMDETHGVKALTVAQQIADAMDIARSPDPAKELSSEAFAWFAAVELMLPFADRQNLMARQGAGESHMTLARSYWVPRAIIDLFFNTDYLKTSNGIRS